MMTYICNPLFPFTTKEAGLDIQGESAAAAGDESADEAAASEGLAAQAEGSANKNSTSVKDLTLLGRIMRKAGKFMVSETYVVID